MEGKKVTYTLKQEKSIQHYLINGDKTAAYKHAYSTSRMKPATINRTAKRLFDLPKICTRIAQEQKATFDRNKATIDEVLSIMADNLRIDPAPLFNDDGSMKNIKDIPKKARMALADIETNELRFGKEVVGEIKKVKFNSRTQIMDMFMKHLGGYEKDNKQQQDNITIFKIPDNGR